MSRMVFMILWRIRSYVVCIIFYYVIYFILNYDIVMRFWCYIAINYNMCFVLSDFISLHFIFSQTCYLLICFFVISNKICHLSFQNRIHYALFIVLYILYCMITNNETSESLRLFGWAVILPNAQPHFLLLALALAWNSLFHRVGGPSFLNVICFAEVWSV